MLSSGTNIRIAVKRFAALASRHFAAESTAEVQEPLNPSPPPPPPPSTKTKSFHGKMYGWQLHCYGDVDELQFSDKLKMPQIRKSDECLVRINATSVNPIDVAMLRGYGSTLLNTLRCQSGDYIEFPLTLGREFCGELVQMGMGVKNTQLKLGSRVWGVVPVSNTSGSHAEYVVVPQSCVSIELICIESIHIS